MESVLDLNNKAAKKYFLRPKNYCSIDLPPYFDFTKIILSISSIMRERELISCCKPINCDKKHRDTPNNYDKVNYLFLTNKNGKYAWRPFQLIHPVIYVSLVNIITKESNWKHIINRFDEFRQDERIECISIPVQSENSDESDKSKSVINWWQGIEQKSIKLSMEFNYMFQTDITDCYGSIYTHSISWALHGKEYAKTNKNRKDYLGYLVDNSLQAMSYGQTNGIPQGSVIMDFIAEILLGYIDLCLIEKLNNLNILNFKILRYRDDYRIFSNSPVDIENIAKTLSETLSEVGLKVNTEKTCLSNDIITDAIKSDKIFFIKNKTSLSSLQKKLLFIRSINQQYPNSGVVVSELSKFNHFLTKRKKTKEDIEVLISILVNIAKSAPKTYPQVTAIISRLIAFKSDISIKKQLVNKIYNALKDIPNNGYLFIWLQRLIHPIDSDFISFSEPLCQFINKKSTIEDLWYSNWIVDEIKNVLLASSIIDAEKLESLPIIIESKEVDLFINYQ